MENKRILLIDDAAFMRMMCKDILAKCEHGYEVVGEADNGLLSVEKYKEVHPDLVLLDIAMPEHDGKWALQKIMEHDPGANVVMLSAVGHASAVVDCLKLGAKGFVVKPFQAERLISTIHRVFEENPQNNPAVLEAISRNAHLSGDCILPQTVVDLITLAVQTANSPMNSGGAFEMSIEAIKEIALKAGIIQAETYILNEAEVASLVSNRINELTKEDSQNPSLFEQVISTALESVPPESHSPDIPTPPAEENLALMRQMVQSQEKIISLLERLVEEK